MSFVHINKLCSIQSRLSNISSKVVGLEQDGGINCLIAEIDKIAQNIEKIVDSQESMYNLSDFQFEQLLNEISSKSITAGAQIKTNSNYPVDLKSSV